MGKAQRCTIWMLAFVLSISNPSLALKADSTARKIVNYEPLSMSSDDVTKYFKTFYSTKASSLDRQNEAFYTTEEFSKDLFSKIDNLLPAPVFVRWLIKTKQITDGSSGSSSYLNSLNAKCNPSSVFDHTLPAILRTWDGDRTIIVNSLEQWHKLNEKTPPTEICNRFKGLTCQYKEALDPDVDQGKSFEATNYTTCQCAGDSSVVGFYKSSVTKTHSGGAYPDGCYVRPWSPCRALSMDPTFKNKYYQWHSSMENVRGSLAQTIFPVGRTPRCREGTYCLDMVPGMKKPICWCNPNSNLKECQGEKQGHGVPRGTELAKIRKAFLKLIIDSSDTKTKCDPSLNQKVIQLMNAAGKDPTRTGAMKIMAELVGMEQNIKICDFREALICDRKTQTCQGFLNCQHGKVHIGLGVCASNNGFSCQTNEECVQNARCKFFKHEGQSACVCEGGYGEQCLLQKKAFFASRLLPVVSGFQGADFIRLETEVNAVLESWEDRMKQMSGEPCDAAGDAESLEVVKFFGSLTKYDKEKGPAMLGKARRLVRESRRLCLYNQFLRCDTRERKCVPMFGNKLKYSSKDESNSMKIVVEVNPNEECIFELPKVFQGIVTFVCSRGYDCKKVAGMARCRPDCMDAFAPPKLCPPAAKTTANVEQIMEETVLTSSTEETSTKAE